MKTGDTVRDAQGRTFQVGQLLGRGLWGRTYAARDDVQGHNWVLKVPHAAQDLPADGARLAEACVEIVHEQARLLESGGCDALPRLETRLVLPDGTPALVLPKAPATLEQRLSGGAPLDEVLSVLRTATLQLRELGSIQPFHGGLKPTNILIGDSGSVLLSDPVTPAFRRVFPQLLAAARGASQWSAPEVREAAGSVPFGAPTDSYSIAMMLYRAAMASPGHERFPELPLDGLNKARLVSLKDRVHNRLQREHSNPRFHTRMADRLAALLNRALSRQTSPSPPYRFRRLDELVQRLGEVQAMVHPTVTGVGRLILDQKAGSETYLTDTPVGFSCTVACSAGVEHHEEIACGLAVFDIDRDERLRLDDCSYTVDRHPSGRFRFGFKLGTLSPGGYRVRVAFAIRESGEEPLTAQGDFRVRAAPGYVPPKQEPVPAPIPLERTRDPDSGAARATSPGVATVGVAGASAPVRASASVQRPAPRRAAVERQRDVAPAASVRAVCSVEDDADPLSGDLPAPTPIAPFTPAERRPPRGRPAPRQAQTALAVKTEPEELDDDDSSSVGRAAPLRPEPLSARRSDHFRARPSPYPDGPLPGHRPTAPARSASPSSAPMRPELPQASAQAAGRSAGAVSPSGRGSAVGTIGTSGDFSPEDRTVPGVSARPAVAPPAVAQEPEPAFSMLGRWSSELPLPVQDDDIGDDDPLGGFGFGPQPDLPEVTLDPDTDDAAGFQGPVGALIARLIETVRGDAYIMFISAATVVILLLAVLLVVMKS